MPEPDDPPYTLAELDRLIDLITTVLELPEGFVNYKINGVYVSPYAVENRIRERLEKMAG